MGREDNLTALLKSEGSALGLSIVETAEGLARHPLYTQLLTLADVQVYMTYQVWCVWDFMSLAKAIQMGVTCMKIPWIPPRDAYSVAYINEIVASEEADITPEGGRASHFETYLQAMREAGVSTAAIDAFIDSLRNGDKYNSALEKCDAPPAAKDFVRSTLLLATGPLHKAIAAFCIGREEVIPRMFITLLGNKPLNKHRPQILSDNRLKTFRWYLERHVKLDIESHGPLSARLFHSILEESPQHREESLVAGLDSLVARKALLDATLSDILEGR